jgi:sodium-dependent phosphate cotransporter
VWAALGGVQRLGTVLLLLFVFLVGISGLGAGFKLLGKDVLDVFFAATANPFVGLVVGILGTTLMQSSSVTTSMIVGMVAAPENPLPIANAIPMIMGANIGTTVTNTVVALGHMGRKDEFYRAFSVATCHDFFNFLAVATLMPLEMATGFLRHLAELVSAGLTGVGGVTYDSPLKGMVKAGLAPVESVAGSLFSATTGQAIFMIVVSAAAIFLALYLLVSVLRAAMKTRVEAYVTRALDINPVAAFVVGIVVTVSVQSSSITTSLLVPLAGAGLLKLRQAFPITLGANVGTTVTALLASLAVSGANAEAGVQIALVHLFFNISGIALMYPLPVTRKFPLRAARWLARTAVASRRWAIVYVVGLFYGLPALLIYVSRLFS